MMIILTKTESGHIMTFCATLCQERLIYIPHQVMYLTMSSNPDDDPVMRSSTERYDRVGVSFRWPQILASASSIFFGFLLSIAVNPPSYFKDLDNYILLAALYAVTVAT